MTVPKVLTLNPVGGLGLDIEYRDNRSVCNKWYVVTTTGHDLAVVLKKIRTPERDDWFKLLFVDGNTEWVQASQMPGFQSPYKRAILANLYGKQCVQCGTTEGQMTIDHVIPRADNGWSSLDNLQLMCQPCNNKKDATWADYRFITPSEIFEIMFSDAIKQQLEME